MGAGVLEGAGGRERMESAAGATGSDPGGAGRTGAGTSGPGSGRRSARNGSGFSGGGGRSSGNWRDGARGVGQALRASRAEAGAAGERLPWSVGALSGGVGASANAGSGFRWGKRIRKRCGRSKARREESTAAGWKGQRNGRVRRRGGTDSQCMTVIVAKTGTGSSARVGGADGQQGAGVRREKPAYER